MRMIALAVAVFSLGRKPDATFAGLTREAREHWRMAPLAELPQAELSLPSKVWMIVLRAYLVIAGGLVLWQMVLLATGGAG